VPADADACELSLPGGYHMILAPTPRSGFRDWEATMPHTGMRSLFLAAAILALGATAHAQQQATEAAPPQAPHSESSTAAGTASAPSPAGVPGTPNFPGASNSPGTANSSGEPSSSSTSQSPLPTVHVTASQGPSADTLKAARDAGFKIKVVDGATHFCTNEAEVGTRFATERCINEGQLFLVLQKRQMQRDELMHLLGAPASAH
jgi:hypothetical protein